MTLLASGPLPATLLLLTSQCLGSPVEAVVAVNWNTSKSSPPVELLARLPKARAAKAAGRLGLAVDIVAQRVRAEYMEMPGLNLTREQARYLWGLELDFCDQVLAYLIDTGFLSRTRDNTYVRAEGR
jgi:hypothetical protein